MGWNPAYTPMSDDFNEIRSSGIEAELRGSMAQADRVARICAPEDLNTALPVLLEQRFPQLAAPKS